MKHFTGISFFVAFALLAAGFCPARAGVGIRTTPRTQEEIWAREQVHKAEQDMLRKLTQYGEQASKGCPLYASVKAELESYYGRTDFSDPGRQSGWYRVERFLKWLSIQEEELKRESVFYMHSGFSRVVKIPVCQMLRKNNDKNISSHDKHSALSVWLGAKYVADIYARPYGIKRMPVFMPGQSRDDGAAAVVSAPGGKKKLGGISFFSEKYSFVEGLNLGIHEGTHLLDWIRGGDGMLNEFATFSTGLLFALPLKPGEETARYRGIRSLNGYLGDKVPCKDFLGEYASFLLGAASYQDLKYANIFSLDQSFSKREGTSAHLLRALAAYKKGKLYSRELLSSPITAQGEWTKAQAVFAAGSPVCKEFLADIDVEEETERMQATLLKGEEAGVNVTLPITVRCGDEALLIEKRGNRWSGVKGRRVSFPQLVTAFAPSEELRDAAARELRQILDGMAKDLDALPTHSAEFLYAFPLPDDSSEGVAACRAFQRHLRGRSAGRVPPVPQGYW